MFLPEERNGRSLGTFQKTFFLSEIGKHRKEKYSRTPLIRTLFIRIANYPDRIGHSGKSVETSKKLTCLEITD
jgi:hypothetical protein